MRGTLRLRRRRPTATPATPTRGFAPPLSWGHVLPRGLAVDHDRTPCGDRSRSRRRGPPQRINRVRTVLTPCRRRRRTVPHPPVELTVHSAQPYNAEPPR